MQVGIFALLADFNKVIKVQKLFKCRINRRTCPCVLEKLLSSKKNVRSKSLASMIGIRPTRRLYTGDYNRRSPLLCHLAYRPKYLDVVLPLSVKSRELYFPVPHSIKGLN